VEGHHRRPSRVSDADDAALIAAVLLLFGLFFQATSPTEPVPPNWERWVTLPGVVDVVGPRPDGKLVAAAGGRLHLVDPHTAGTTPFGSAAASSHIAMAPGRDVTGAGCRFEAGEVYALEQGAINRVTLDGSSSRFVEPPAVDRLTGIAFDTDGRFGNQLLVAGRKAGRTVLFSIDCRGRLKTLTEDAPPMEGGMEVAPQMFGGHGGDLLGADEVSGDVIFIRYDGTSGVLIRPNLPAGAGVGVRSVGFTAPGFIGRAGTAYVAGTDALWRITAENFSQVAIDENDLIVTTAAGGRTAVVRCRTTCRTFPFGDAAGARIQGHVTVVLGPPPPELAKAGAQGTAIFAIVTAVIVAGGFILFFVHNRRKVRIPEPERP
jgi:hypothetical protein